MIDLRSDTVTRPSPDMKAAMFDAPVGDDVYSEDPTVNRLEAELAAMFGKDAAIFVPSGTMANQIAVRLHCRPGEEILCEATSHVLLWEGGAPAALSGVTLRPIVGQHGLLNSALLNGCIRPDDIHSTQTRLLWLENTHNRGGGTIQSLASVSEMCHWARSHGLATHLDGARLWNAIAATGTPAHEWAKHFDTINVCFSKGLGAPVGSALIGNRDQITLAKRYRKLFGGAMRQAGFLAAACLYAMNHHVDRLRDDHANAQIIAAAVRDTPGLTLVPSEVQTNLVWFEIDCEVYGSPQNVTRQLKEAGVLMSALGESTIRACTHLDVSTTECEKAAKIIQRLQRA